MARKPAEGSPAEEAAESPNVEAAEQAAMAPPAGPDQAMDHPVVHKPRSATAPYPV